jgi:malate dehydrogenase (oxaloacetate-decarboxylating)(NADP+)
VCALEPSFGAINLEDIKAPDCFIVERICRERMNIPVFHDDQHGTAIVVGAAATNALQDRGQAFEDIKVVSTGGGAAGIACLNMLLKLGCAARKRLAVRSSGAGLRGSRGRR